MDILASATDSNYQGGKSIEVGFLIQKILASQGGDQSMTEKPKAVREMTNRAGQSGQSHRSIPGHAVKTSINVATSLGKRSMGQTDLGAETKEVKRARGALDDKAITNSNGSQVAEGSADQNINAHPAQRKRLMDTNGSNTRKRSLETEIKPIATKKSKVDPSPKTGRNSYSESSSRLTGNMGKAGKKKARFAPLAAVIGAKSNLDLGKMRQEQEAARRARVSATPMPAENGAKEKSQETKDKAAKGKKDCRAQEEKAQTAEKQKETKVKKKQNELKEKQSKEAEVNVSQVNWDWSKDATTRAQLHKAERKTMAAKNAEEASKAKEKEMAKNTEEKETAKNTEEKEKEKEPKTLLDDLLAGVLDHNKRYNLPKKR
ncbi:hypothetical protein BGZ47_004756 [Haplosporangium gracile]|nr:hypothetical protein BGZ47_004756 [Haplosporangium gracile]